MVVYEALDITAIGNGTLHRAFVALPRSLCEPGDSMQERNVFFEAPSLTGRGQHLAHLLAAVWGEETADWVERGFIYNTKSVTELIRVAFGDHMTGELRLLEVGAGGLSGLGEHRILYARHADVDLFVSPRVATRLRQLLAQVERMYESDAATGKN
jgi:hypothetical protein